MNTRLGFCEFFGTETMWEFGIFLQFFRFHDLQYKYKYQIATEQAKCKSFRRVALRDENHSFRSINYGNITKCESERLHFFCHLYYLNWYKLNLSRQRACFKNTSRDRRVDGFRRMANSRWYWICMFHLSTLYKSHQKPLFIAWIFTIVRRSDSLTCQSAMPRHISSFESCIYFSMS